MRACTQVGTLVACLLVQAARAQAPSPPDPLRQALAPGLARVRSGCEAEVERLEASDLPPAMREGLAAALAVLAELGQDDRLYLAYQDRSADLALDAVLFLQLAGGWLDRLGSGPLQVDLPLPAHAAVLRYLRQVHGHAAGGRVAWARGRALDWLDRVGYLEALTGSPWCLRSPAVRAALVEDPAALDGWDAPALEAAAPEVQRVAGLLVDGLEAHPAPPTSLGQFTTRGAGQLKSQLPWALYPRRSLLRRYVAETMGEGFALLEAPPPGAAPAPGDPGSAGAPSTAATPGASGPAEAPSTPATPGAPGPAEASPARPAPPPAPRPSAPPRSEGPGALWPLLALAAAALGWLVTRRRPPGEDAAGPDRPRPGGEAGDPSGDTAAVARQRLEVLAPGRPPASLPPPPGAVPDWLRAAVEAAVGPRYSQLHRIGAGGMGSVLRAWDTRLERTVAIKVPPPHLAELPAFRARFLREARALARLDHPQVGRVIDVPEVDPAATPVMILEYLEGMSLAELLDAGGPPPVARTLAWMRQAGEGLAHAHRRDVLHRDVKPGNLMLVGEDVKVVDFGLAAVEGQSRLTESGMVMGSLGYMPPEQLAGAVLDARSDVYSLAVSTFELVTGGLPFSDDDRYHLDPPSPSARRPDLPAAFDRVLGVAMRPRPEERQASMDDFLADLDELIALGPAAWGEERAAG